MTRTLLPLALVLLAACGGSSADDGSAAEPVDTAPPVESTVEPPSESAADSSPPATEPVPTNPAPAPAQTIVSADGMVALDVPAGAVPEGTDITIEPTSGPEGTRAAYDFGPDGLEFNEPARLEWSLVLPDDDISAFSLGLVLDDGAIEQLDGTDAELSEDGMILSADVEHFTDFVVVERTDAVQTSPTEPVLLGQEFHFGVFSAAAEDDLEIHVSPNSPAPLDPNLFWPVYRCDAVGPILVRALVHPDAPDRSYSRFLLRAECIEERVGALTLEAAGADVTEFPGPVEIAVTDETISFAFTPQAIDQAQGGSIGTSMVGRDGNRYADCYVDYRGEQAEPICTVVDGTGQLVGEATATFLVDTDGRGVLSIPGDTFSVGDGALNVNLGDESFGLGELYVNLFDVNGERSESAIVFKSDYERLGPGATFDVFVFR